MEVNPLESQFIHKLAEDTGYSEQEIALALTAQSSADAINNSLSSMGGVTSKASATLKGYPVTQKFGNKNPNVEVFSKGINTGVDIGVPSGVPVSLPSGNWNVVSAYSGAKGRGYIGNNENQGYGNSVVVRNADTGEVLRFSHLSAVDLASEKLSGGDVIGFSGATGNVTGPHLDVEYMLPNGQMADFMQSKYAREVGL